MQNLIYEDQSAKLRSKSVLTKSSLWNQLGPVLLLGSFAVLVLKCAPVYWPFALTAFAGYATTLCLAKRGLFLSYFILVATFILAARMGTGFFWPLMLSFSIALSWMLIFLGNQERTHLELIQEEKVQSLEEESRQLEKQLREARGAISKECKDLILEKERLIGQLNESIAKCKRVDQALQESEKTREKLAEKCEGLSQDIFAAQRREVSFQHALEDAQTQLLKLKNQLTAISEQPKEVLSNVVPMEEISQEEQMRIEQAQHQYANLRLQFEEKSQALDLARKELFKTENELLTLQKAFDEKAHEDSEEQLFLIRDLKRMEEEIRDLESQVTTLQELITSLLSAPKKRAVRPKKSSGKVDQGLPLLLQEKINQISTEAVD